MTGGSKAVVLVGIAAGALALAGAAAAGSTPEGARCSFEPRTKELSLVVKRDPTYLDGTSFGSVTVYAAGGKIGIEAGDGWWPVRCPGGRPSTAAVDSIRVATAPRVTHLSVILAGDTSALAPGATPEPHGDSEIEVEIDTEVTTSLSVYATGDRADHIDLGGLGGATAINLNAEESVADADVVMDRGFVAVSSGGGADTVRAAPGLPGFDGPYPGSKKGPALIGAGGGDTLVGSELSDSLVGLRGRDRLRAGGGSDYVAAADDRRETVDCGLGRDTAELDRNDRRRSCERLPSA